VFEPPLNAREKLEGMTGIFIDLGGLDAFNIQISLSLF
jgi:hypothetical protein